MNKKPQQNTTIINPNAWKQTWVCVCVWCLKRMDKTSKWENLSALPFSTSGIRGFYTMKMFSELILAVLLNGKQSVLTAGMCKVSWVVPLSRSSKGRLLWKEEQAGSWVTARQTKAVALLTKEQPHSAWAGRSEQVRMRIYISRVRVQAWSWLH